MAEIASGSIDLKSLKVAGEPNKYITYIDNKGIRVHEAGAVNTNFVQVNATGMQIYNGGQTDDYKIAEFGENIRIGQLKSNHININSDAIRGYTSNRCVWEASLSGAILPVKIVVDFGTKYIYELGPRETMSKAITELDVLTTGMSFQLSIRVLLGYKTYNFVYGTASSAEYGAIAYDGTNVISLTNALSSSATQAVGTFMYAIPEDAPMWTFGDRKGGSTNGGYSYAAGSEVEASGDYSHAEGKLTVASGDYSHAEGSGTVASGNYSHTEGFHTTASYAYAHVEGDSSEASEYASHAEGYNTTASGYAAHAEGKQTIASGSSSHAEGTTVYYQESGHAVKYVPTASGNSAHVEGQGSVASGDSSHAQNEATIAASKNQTALGRWNVEDANGTYAVIVGNGASYPSTRKNAAALEWAGNLRLKGDVYVGCNDDSSGGSLVSDFVVATETYRVTTYTPITWTVKKWRSGYCEAFGKGDSKSYAMTQGYANWAYTNDRFDLPANLFKTVTYAQIDRCGGSSTAGLITASLYNMTTSMLQFYAFTGASSTLDVSFMARVVGTWK